MNPGSPFAGSRDGVHVLPVLHERLEYADLVRRAFETLDPDGVVVEVPSSLTGRWREAVERLPSISVLLFDNSAGRTIYLPVQPADALVEASRLAIERGLRWACGDLDVDGYGDHRDPAPDSYAATRLGYRAVFEAFRAGPRRRDSLDAPRERSLAYHAHRLRAEGCRRVLLVTGMHHAEALLAHLEREQAAPLTPPRRRNLRLVHLHPESLGETLGEVPFYAAAYERRRLALPEPPAATDPAPLAAGREYGPFRVLSGGRGDDPLRIEQAVAAAACEAGWPDWPSWEAERGGGETPGAGAGTTVPGPLDRLRLQWSLLRRAEQALTASAPDEQLQPWQRANLARFSRNLARLHGRLIVDLIDLLAAARGCVSDNFAWELHRLAIAYPWQKESAAGLATARIRADEMFDGVRRIRLTRRRARRKRAAWDRFLRRRRRDESRPGEWLEGFDSNAICSYPPEDEIVENFGRFLRRRGKRILSEERSRTLPFTTSVLDGIDVRETIRHWSEGRIYVRELGRVPGGIGSVVVIFDEDDDGEERFPHCQTWLGEHAQESDMAYYATEPTRGIVGPGICRVTYGGFLLSYPPRRMAEVWSDADYRFAERKSEILLLAGLDYSEERTVVYAAARPPRAVFQQIAARVDRKILYLPLGTLSPATLRKIRVMHILSGYDKRESAGEYIW